MKYNSTKDALNTIMREYGAEVLLGRLNAHLADLTDATVSEADKRLVYSVYENGAAAILEANIDEDDIERDVATQKAIQKLVDEAYISRDGAEKIVCEFTAALGWWDGEPLTPAPATEPVYSSGRTPPTNLGKDLVYCPICGQLMNTPADYCPHCGTPYK